jgi:DNA-binding SARP family transcriptional activator
MLQIRLLGVLQLSIDGSVLPSLQTQKALGLLGYLILHAGQELTREHLAELFWPDRPKLNARRSLHTAIWQIRSIFKNSSLKSEDYLIATSTTVSWAPEVEHWVDVPEFEKAATQATLQNLQTAIDLYRGSFLSNVYEDWCLEERYRLEAYYLHALTKLVSYYLGSSRFSIAMETCRLLLKEDPLNEIGHRGIMLAYYHLGNRSAAIEQFFECGRLLRKELDIEPAEETRVLYQSILDETIPYTPPVTGSLSADTLVKSTRPGPIDSTVDLESTGIFGRDDQFQSLADWWNDGSEFIAVLHGDQGVGRTRLAQEFIRRLQSTGVLVGWGRCLPVGQEVPHFSIRMAIYDLIANAPSSVRTQIPEWQAAEISLFIPELVEIFGISPKGDTAQLAQNKIFSATCNFINSVNKSSPLLLVIDDINFASKSTFHLIEFLVRYLLSVQTSQNHKIHILMTSNEALFSSHQSISLMRLRRDHLVKDISIGNLLPEDVARWIVKDSGNAKNARRLADALYNKTLGNPLFIHETLSALVENDQLYVDHAPWEGSILKTGPLRLPLATSIKQLIESRLLPLSESAQETIQAAAVIGSYFDVHELQTLTGRQERNIIKDLEALVAAQIIQVNSPPKKHEFEFTHDLIHQAVYEMILPPMRTLLHRKLARKLIEDSGEKAASRILFHYSNSNDLEASVKWAVIAARHAIQLSDYSSAAAMLQDAEENGYDIQIPAISMLEIVQMLGETFSALHDREKIYQYAKQYAEMAQHMNINGWQEISARWLRMAKLGTGELSQI